MSVKPRGRIAQSFQGMAFSPYSNEMARYAVVKEARETFLAYLKGSEKAYAVNDILSELEEIMKESAENAIKAAREAMESDDEQHRWSLMTNAIEQLSRIVIADRL